MPRETTITRQRRNAEPDGYVADYDTDSHDSSINHHGGRGARPATQRDPHTPRPPALGDKRSQQRMLNDFANKKTPTKNSTAEPDEGGKKVDSLDPAKIFVDSMAEKMEVGSTDSTTSEARAGTPEHRKEAIERFEAFMRDRPELVPQLSSVLKELEEADKGMTKYESANRNTPPSQFTNPMDHMSHTQDRQSKMFEQQMAMQEANMGQQMMMSSWQQISQTVTAFTQAANTETSALCNTIIDCVKAISDLLRKGGAAMGGAVGN